MSKKAIARKDAPQTLVDKVRAVVDAADKNNRYSTSKIYGAHNEVMGLDEVPETCSSCLVRRVAALRKWLDSEQSVDTKELRNAVFGNVTPAKVANPDTAEYDAPQDPKLTEEEKAANAPNYSDPSHPNFVAPALGVVRYPMGEDALPFDFTPSEDDVLKGTVKAADGTNVKAGTYTAADGTIIAVSVGNKATLKDDVL